MTEEERRRCIILGACQADMTREEALAREMAMGANGDETLWRDFHDAALVALRFINAPASLEAGLDAQAGKLADYISRAESSLRAAEVVSEPYITIRFRRGALSESQRPFFFEVGM